jgi:hypothetical protein
MRSEPASTILDLRSDVLASPTRLDIAVIEAAMLWPDDPEMQDNAIRSAFVELSYSIVDQLSPQQKSEVISVAREALPIRTLMAEVKKSRFIKGVIVGSVLHGILVKLSLDPENASKKSIITACIAPFQETKNSGYLRISEKTFDNDVWPRFKSVAHFWAAAFKAQKFDGGRAFPCDLANLAAFLSDAEFYRLEGERARTWKAKEPILREGDAIMLPKSLGIKPSVLDFRRSAQAPA